MKPEPNQTMTTTCPQLEASVTMRTKSQLGKWKKFSQLLSRIVFSVDIVFHSRILFRCSYGFGDRNRLVFGEY